MICIRVMMFLARMYMHYTDKRTHAWISHTRAHPHSHKRIHSPCLLAQGSVQTTQKQRAYGAQSKGESRTHFETIFDSTCDISHFHAISTLTLTSNEPETPHFTNHKEYLYPSYLLVYRTFTHPIVHNQSRIIRAY